MQQNFSEEELNIFFNGSTAFLAIFDNDGKFVKLNQKWEQQFNIPTASLINTSIFDLILEEDRELTQKIYQNLFVKQHIANHFFRWVDKDQNILTFSCDLVYKNDLIYFRGQDVTTNDKEHRSLEYISKLSSTGAWEHNPITNHSHWSKECYQIYGISEDTEITTPLLLSMFQEPYRTEIENHMKHLYKNGEKYEHIGQIITFDGIKKWIKTNAKPILNNGKVILIHGISADVTKEQNLINKIQENNELQRLALRGIKSGLFFHNVSEKVLTYGPDFMQMLGIKERDQLSQDEYFELIHWEDREEAVKRFEEELLKKDDHYFNYYRLKHQDGQNHHYEIYAWKRRNAEGKVIQMIGNLIDVEEKVKAQLENKKYLLHLEAVLNNGFLYTFLLDTEGYVLLADQDSIDFTVSEFNINPMKRKTLFKEVVPDHMLLAFDDSISRALKGEVVRKEVERSLHTGASIWLDVMYRPIRNEDDVVEFIIINLNDITLRKHAEELMEEGLKRAEHLNALKLNILSNINHELRTPLHTINATNMLLSETPLSQEQKEILDMQTQGCERIINTISGLVNLSMLKAQSSMLVLNPVALSSVVTPSYEKRLYMARTKGLEMNLHLPKETIELKINEEMFTVALDQIINNAIKYTSKGRIDIDCDKDESSDFILIKVKDTGIGIEKEKLDEVFEDFVQGSIGLSRRYEGTGIGLSISKKYLEMMGGDILVESEQGKGAVFTVKLPIYKE